MVVNLADIIFNLENKTCYVPQRVTEYFVESDKFDISLTVSDEDVEKEKNFSEPGIGNKKLRLYATYRKILTSLPQFDAFAFHAATIDMCGVGIAFAAKSGTGKTTHMRLWQEFLGDKMTVVNGDKPIVRFFDSLENAPGGTELGVPYAYGTPWNGKEKLGCNMRTPLKHICFIERSEKNFVEKIGKEDAINRVFNQVYMPSDPAAMANTMSLINRLLEACNLWIIHCNMDISAAQTAYNAIFN